MLPLARADLDQAAALFAAPRVDVHVHCRPSDRAHPSPLLHHN